LEEIKGGRLHDHPGNASNVGEFNSDQKKAKNTQKRRDQKSKEFFLLGGGGRGGD